MNVITKMLKITTVKKAWMPKRSRGSWCSFCCGTGSGALDDTAASDSALCASIAGPGSLDGKAASEPLLGTSVTGCATVDANAASASSYWGSATGCKAPLLTCDGSAAGTASS